MHQKLKILPAATLVATLFATTANAHAPRCKVEWDAWDATTAKYYLAAERLNEGMLSLVKRWDLNSDEWAVLRGLYMNYINTAETERTATLDLVECLFLGDGNSAS